MVWLKRIYYYFHRTVKRLLLECRYQHLYLSSTVMLSKHVTFGRNNALNRNVVFLESSIGDFSYINYNSIVNVTSIGKFCSIGPNCVIGLGNHPTRKFVSTSSFLYTKGIFLEKTYYDEHLPVTIGNDVWIGANVTVINGIHIGDGAVVAANSVVTRDVPSYSVCGGCPAQVLRKRFEAEDIEFLLNLKWWDKDSEWIKTHATLFFNIEELMSNSGIL